MSTPDAGSAVPEPSADVTGLDRLARRALALGDGSPRVIVGITGSPGAGKTTLAIRVAQRINELAGDGTQLAVHLPMDGFHLANSTLDRLGTHDRKGAIDTFDGWGYLALLHRIRTELEHVVYAPSFDRRVDEGVAGEIAILPESRIVLTEGNYLLADQEPWSAIPAVLAESWFCETSEEERLRRLVDRHERHGRSAEEAEAWAKTVDGGNALLIEASAPRATIRISGEGSLEVR